MYERKSVRVFTDQAIKDRLAETCDHHPFIARAKLVLIFCADCQKWHEGFRQTGCQPRKPGVGDLLLAVSDRNSWPKSKQDAYFI